MPHQQWESFIEACNRCAAACNHGSTECLQEQDVKMMARCIALDMDCAAVCQLAAAAMARGSGHVRAIGALCGDVFQACAAECAKREADHCQACAEACRRCAEECSRMGCAQA